MANKILASVFSRFSNSIFAPSRFQKRIYPKSQFNDGRTRAAQKKCCSSQTSGTKGKTISRKYQPHKRYAKSNFISLL